VVPPFVIVLATALNLAAGLRAPAGEADAFARTGQLRTEASRGDDGRLYGMTVGTAGDRVAFVIFTRSPPGAVGITAPVNFRVTIPVEPVGGPRRVSVAASLNLAGGVTARLPLRAQLVEVTEGRARVSGRRVTREEAEAFLASRPAAYTLDALLSFADARRTGRGR
jgi:hypothetical protein